MPVHNMVAAFTAFPHFMIGRPLLTTLCVTN